MAFVGHGQFRLEVVGRVVIETLTGDFNLEQHRALETELHRTAESLGRDGPWAILADLRQFSLPHHDFLARGSQGTIDAYRSQMALGLRAECVVVRSTAHGNILKTLYPPPPEMDHAIFADLSAAIAWLGERGFAVDASHFSGH